MANKLPVILPGRPPLQNSAKAGVNKVLLIGCLCDSRFSITRTKGRTLYYINVITKNSKNIKYRWGSGSGCLAQLSYILQFAKGEKQQEVKSI